MFLCPDVEQFVAGQVSAGEFAMQRGRARGARLLRDQQESRALVEMRTAFADVDPTAARANRRRRTGP